MTKTINIFFFFFFQIRFEMLFSFSFFSAFFNFKLVANCRFPIYLLFISLLPCICIFFLHFDQTFFSPFVYFFVLIIFCFFGFLFFSFMFLFLFFCIFFNQRLNFNSNFFLQLVFIFQMQTQKFIKPSWNKNYNMNNGKIMF